MLSFATAGLIALASSSTAAGAEPCELPTDLALQAEQAVIEARFDDMNSLLPRFEASLSCAPPVDPLTLAAFLRAEGAWFHLTNLTDEAHLAFQSAARLAPGAWTPAFGEELRAVFDTAARQPLAGQGTVQMEPPPADPHLAVYIDGARTNTPIQLSAGLHALQLVRTETAPVPSGTARFGRLVAVFPNEDIRINPGVLPIETPPPALGVKSRGPIWLLASAGGALVISGATAAIALNQPKIAEEAGSLAEVNQAEQRQRRMAFTSYSLLGVTAVATGLYLAW